MTGDSKHLEHSGITAKDIGDKLRKAREQQGLSVEDLQKITKLRTRYIEALESGDFDVFSGDVYAKGAIRNYAEAVNQDFTELWEVYEQIFQKEQEEKAEAQSNPDTGSKIAEQFSKIFPTVVRILIIALLLGAVGYGGFLAYEYLAGVELNDEEEVEDVVEPGENEENDQEDEEKEPEKDEKKESVEPDVSRVSDDPITYEISDYEQEDIEALLEIGEHEAGCWVQITVDDQSPEDLGTMAAEEQDTVTFQESMEFYLGRPENTSITILDTELDIPDTTSPESIFIQLEGLEETSE